MEYLIFDDMTQVTEAQVAHLLPLVSVQRREQALRFKHVFGQFVCLKAYCMLIDLVHGSQCTDSVHDAQCTMHGDLLVHGSQCTMHGDLSVHDAQCTMHGDLSVHDAQCTMHGDFSVHSEGVGLEDWVYNEWGKPMWKGGPYFSISHCKEGIAVVVDDKPVGIDIESVRKVDKSLVERTMNAQEREWIAKAADPQRAFVNLWTQKEAVLKMKGTGLVGDLYPVLEDTGVEVRTWDDASKPYLFSIAREK